MSIKGPNFVIKIILKIFTKVAGMSIYTDDAGEVKENKQEWPMKGNGKNY